NGQTENAIQTDVRLRERCFGTMQGKHSSLLLEHCRHLGVSADEHAPEGGGESWGMVRDRVLDFLQTRLLQESAECSKVLLVSHGGIIREIVKHFASFGHSSWRSEVIVGKFNPNRDITSNTSVSD